MAQWLKSTSLSVSCPPSSLPLLSLVTADTHWGHFTCSRYGCGSLPLVYTPHSHLSTPIREALKKWRAFSPTSQTTILKRIIGNGKSKLDIMLVLFHFIVFFCCDSSPIPDNVGRSVYAFCIVCIIHSMQYAYNALCIPWIMHSMHYRRKIVQYVQNLDTVT